MDWPFQVGDHVIYTDCVPNSRWEGTRGVVVGVHQDRLDIKVTDPGPYMRHKAGTIDKIKHLSLENWAFDNPVDTFWVQRDVPQYVEIHENDEWLDVLTHGA